MRAVPPLPPELDEARREEARRQAESQGGAGLETAAEIAETTVEVAADGAFGLLAEVAGAALHGTLAVAKTSVEVAGGILGGLADL